MAIILINKKEGETPLEALQYFRSRNKIYKEAKMTYAGRLDPMAKGLLLVLVGEETKKKEKYLKLPKEYEFEALFGFATDTYDILGQVQHSHTLKNIGMLRSRDKLRKKIKNNLKFFIGKFPQKYPLYSSPNIKKVRAGEIFEQKEREVEVKKIKFMKPRKINGKKLLAKTERRIGKVRGDFRQKEILKIWQKNLTEKSNKFFIASFKIKCGSGTYVRGIANSLGEKIGIPSLAFSIKRVKIGSWKLPSRSSTRT